MDFGFTCYGILWKRQMLWHAFFQAWSKCEMQFNRLWKPADGAWRNSDEKTVLKWPLRLILTLTLLFHSSLEQIQCQNYRTKQTINVDLPMIRRQIFYKDSEIIIVITTKWFSFSTEFTVLCNVSTFSTYCSIICADNTMDFTVNIIRNI